ncbi:MAG: helix-turn-helix domain-containing protein [Actinomycetota bacterium]
MSRTEKGGSAGHLIRDARLRAELSQRELARLSSTSQSAIADYESGRKSPRFGTLTRILRAAGFELRMRLVPNDDHDEWVTSVERNLSPQLRKRVEQQTQALRNAQPVSIVGSREDERHPGP